MPASSLTALQNEIRSCRRCADAGHPIQGAPVFSGRASARIFIVGQAPGAREAELGKPFCGPSGQRLFAWLGKAGFSENEVRAHAYISALTRCYPGRAASGRGDRVPTREELGWCRVHLDAELARVKPELILPVGRLAVRVFCGGAPLDALVGTLQRDADGRWILPLPHPSGASAWLNRNDHAAHLDRAIRHLTRLRQRLGL